MELHVESRLHLREESLHGNDQSREMRVSQRKKERHPQMPPTFSGRERDLLSAATFAKTRASIQHRSWLMRLPSGTNLALMRLFD